jgi:hypothetical protein
VQKAGRERFLRAVTVNAVRGATTFSCRTPVKMLDVTAPGSGNVATAFIDPTRPANRPLLEASIYEDTVSQWEELACGYD